VAGFSGLGKSTLLMVMAYNMWMRGFNPLFISLEMERRVIMRRWDAMATGIDYWKLKHLELEEVSLADWRVAADQITHKPCDITVIDSLRGCTADHIFSEMIRHKPDVVFIDYLSLMRSARAARGSKLWQTLGEITQDLKQNARTLKIPIIAAAQTNRSASKEGAELDNIAYSISAIQDPDIVIGLHADEEMHKAKRMEIRLNKNRDGKLGRFYAVWDHDKQHFREEIMGDRFKRVSGE
jgi:replicative DNA helicase